MTGRGCAFQLATHASTERTTAARLRCVPRRSHLVVSSAHQRSTRFIQELEVDDLRDAIEDATSPQYIINALTAMHAMYPEGQSLRFRSSSPGGVMSWKVTITVSKSNPSVIEPAHIVTHT